MLYVIAGDDTFRKSEKIAAIIKEGDYERFNVVSLEDAIRDALSPGLFSKKAMVFEGKEIPYKDSKPLEPVVNSENAVILDITSVDGRTKLGKWLNKQKCVERINALNQFQEDKIKAELAMRSLKLGLDLSIHAKQYLLEAVGPDIGRMQRELELIKAYFGDGQVLATELPTLVPDYAQTSYQLATALTEFPKTVYERTQSLIDLGIHPLQILATLINRIEKLMLTAIGIESGLAREQIAEELLHLPNNGRVFYLIKDVEYLSAKQLQQAFVELCGLTHRLKRGTQTERLPLELALIASKLA
ncbi:DNA polymerase III subunit delta [Crocosphaera subtropica]|nr:DNA polymerase III subunit delta [Crocosphaera subtropica]